MNKNWMKWGTAFLGIMFLVAGILMIVQGQHTRGELVKSLLDEKLEVQDPAVLLSYETARAPEGVEVPEIIIDDAMEAYYQAQVIRVHTLASTEGKTYSEMDREDPGRDLYIRSLTLQNSLHMAHMGLEITRLIIGLGVAFSGLGLGTLVLGLPLVNKVYA